MQNEEDTSADCKVSRYTTNSMEGLFLKLKVKFQSHMVLASSECTLHTNNYPSSTCIKTHTENYMGCLRQQVDLLCTAEHCLNQSLCLTIVHTCFTWKDLWLENCIFPQYPNVWWPWPLNLKFSTRMELWLQNCIFAHIWSCDDLYLWLLKPQIYPLISI